MAVLLLLALFAWGADNPVNPPQNTCIELMQSLKESDRAAGQLGLLTYRDEAIRAMLLTIEAPRRKAGDAWLDGKSVRNMAVFCAGEYRATETAAALSNLLEPQQDEIVDIITTLRLCPAGVALVKIGNPAIPHMMEILKNNSRGWAANQAKLVLIDIEGLDGTKAQLQNAIAAEKNATKKAILVENLKSIQEDKKP
jgi:hypothetical protein